MNISTRNLSRRFGDFVAVDKLDLSIEAGEIFGLLGPNAAGKSTSIRMLTGILRPDSGDASILGFDLFEQTEIIKQHIGYVAQQFSLYPDLTVFENIVFYAGLYGVDDRDRLEALMTLYDLDQFRDRRAEFLSGGFKRRLAIACATTHEPELVFLDEPTAGIDPVTRKELWDLFYDLASQGKTLFVTTHYMEEAERCHRLAFLNHGKLVAQGTPAAIRDAIEPNQVYSCEIGHDPELTRALLATSGIQLLNQLGDELRIIVEPSVSSDSLQQLISEHHQQDFRLLPVKPSIEDAFMSLTSDGEHG